jgi:hypothetical protein
MNPAATKQKVETVLAHRYGHIFERREKLSTETLPTGIAEIDRLLHGIPRGVITEIHGATSSGRTSLMLSTLANATSQDETCALVDCSDTFDLSSAAKAGLDFDRVLWIRCADNLERSFKAVDLLLHGGGFGLVVLNLSDVPAQSTSRIIASWWFRFRRAIENTPTALIVINPNACVRSCAALVLELKNEQAVWSSTVSLISKKANGNFTKRREDLPAHLSLVAAPKPPPDKHSPQSQSHLIEGLCIRVNRVRPVEWSGAITRFAAAT